MIKESTILTENLAKEFASFFKYTEKELFIMAPYVSKEGVNFIHKNLDKNVSITAIFSFNSDDLLGGYTDLDAIRVLKEKGAKISFLENLHAKCFIADNEKILLGSANITGSGMGLHNNSNIEFMQSSIVSKELVNKIVNVENQIQLTEKNWSKLKDLIIKAQKDQKKVKKTKSQEKVEGFIHSLGNIKSIDFIAHCEGSEDYKKQKGNAKIYTNGKYIFKAQESRVYEPNKSKNGYHYKYSIDLSLFEKLKAKKIHALVFRKKVGAKNPIHDKDIFTLPYKILKQVLDYENHHSNIVIIQKGENWYLTTANKNNIMININTYKNVLPHLL